MDLRSLQYAVTLAEELHFGRAARRHFISEQPFGRRIRHLEEEIGVRVFDRTSRRVALTPAGALLIADARRLLASVDGLSARAERASGRSVFRLGVLGFGAAGLWEAMRSQFTADNPELGIEYSELDFTTQHSMLQDGVVDAAIIGALEPVRGVTHDLLFESPLAVLVPAGSRLARREFLSLAEVAEHDLLRLDGLGDDETLAGQLGERILSAPRIANPASIPMAVATTGRLSLHSILARRFYAHPGVAVIPTTGTVSIVLATRTGDERQPVVSIRKAARAAAANRD
ncbi:LysR substrate-binding domain-containing protein [Embleya sp. NBC_00888]|uniref:LysR family transcriptional regulator n=1 Tax=Embleya sp. NBC_00888 TaxID=2975960 RepID=UPI00386CA210|nr:LysR substrate-binding domain-containing protein [Embleya sp. NBC_00888]